MANNEDKWFMMPLCCVALSAAVVLPVQSYSRYLTAKEAMEKGYVQEEVQTDRGVILKWVKAEELEESE